MINPIPIPLPKREEYKCLNCNVIVFTAKDFIAHISIHNRIHIRPTSLIYFTYNKLKELNLISRYTKWEDWPLMYSQISIPYDIYLEYLEANRDTCGNRPCDMCLEKRSLGTMTEKNRRKLLNQTDESDKIVKPFTVSKYGKMIFDK